MIDSLIAGKTVEAVQKLYGQEVKPESISLQKTRPEFEGDLTLTVFPLTKISRKAPELTANEIGNYLAENLPEITRFNVIKGFLNLVIDDNYYLRHFYQNLNIPDYGYTKEGDSKPVMVEYSSPNTNKPLHLGHIRNNLLGWSVAEILKANGKKVLKVNLVNDRGIHICKSMLAWQRWGNGETPESSGMKGDHLIGKYYVMFDQEYKKQLAELKASGMSDEEAANQAPLMGEAREMLQKWEKQDAETIRLWKMMNEWVYKGFDETYKRLGIDFDKIYYESQTYLLGKKLVENGLKDQVLFRKDDDSVWADLTSDGLDEKLLLRSDGTSVYMTQDLGTAKLRYDEFEAEKMIYVVGNEQNYHFDVLKLVLKKLGYDWAENILHLNYGMVELPEGKMKSREGTVVDADDLMDEMYTTAKETTEQLGKSTDFTSGELDHLYHIAGLSALKYFILKVDPKKNMVFNPKESIDFNGNTGTFIQYTYARIQSVLRKAPPMPQGANNETPVACLPKEKELLKLIYDFPAAVKLAGDTLSPAQIANYTFDLAKEFNQFYHDITILQ
ncbi:MAG TPA: arginine--tRNA ligase, partial [Bacteroidales bacterium]|nr:arginine--tRNA ligase [Bacteroidales bacterium]